MIPLLLSVAAAIAPPAEAPPFRQPQLAVRGGQVAMAFGGGSAIYVSVSADGGRTFGEPRKVAEVGALALGRHRGPRIVMLKDAWVISAVAGDRTATGPHAHGLPESGNLLVWRSTDRGRTWLKAGAINDVPGAAREGLHAMAADGKGVLTAAWLDLREKGTRLFSARSIDGGVTWSKNALVYESPDGTICQCCHPSLAIDAKGGVTIMWRNALDGSRDLYLARSSVDGGFSPARKLGAGTWKLNACPMDGGAILVDGDRLVSAWRREGEIYMTDGDDAEKRIGEGKDVALARGKSGIYAAWTRGKGLEILTPDAAAASPLAAEGAFVTLLAQQDGSVLAAWEAKNSIETRRIERR